MLDQPHDPASPLLRGSTFNCRVRPERSRVRVEVEGELDIATAEELRECLRELVGAGFEGVVVDLGGVTFMDSSGLRVLIEESNDAGANGTAFSLARLRPAVQQVLSITGTEHLFVVDGAPRTRDR